MTELDDLKDAMESTPDFEPAPLNLNHVLTAGGRIRRRRRFAAGTASGVAVLALVVGGGQMISGAATRSPAGSEFGSAPSYPSGPYPSYPSHPNPSYPNPTYPSHPNPSHPNPTSFVPDPQPSVNGGPGILGTVVETGQKIDGRRWIIYVLTADPDRLNDNITLVLGRTKTGYINDFTKDILGSDPGSGRMEQGFHAVKAGTIKDGRTTPTFGYYAGDAARITARDTTTGKTIEAHLTAWKGFGKQERAQIFWFDFTQGQTPTTLTGLTAYDNNGNKLPAGNNTPTGS
jgi:hypothetical protein